MPKSLIIVESPSKARTLAKFLGAGYTVKASMGHVRDLPKSKIGVDVDNGFTPDYIVIKGKEKQIKELRDAVKKADVTLLAADPDREGEAIAWHLAEALNLKNPDRVVFHEITSAAVGAALKDPRKIDRDLVHAQEARRVIDRLVGYRLSPLLWRKVRKGLSAGRVQSVAVRLVVDRESEIAAFIAKETWSLDALLRKQESDFRARYLGRRATAEPERAELGTQAQALEILAALNFTALEPRTKEALGPDGEVRRSNRQPTLIVDATRDTQQPPFVVEGVESNEISRNALPPYTTSTLQQDASTRLRISPRRTMSIAQQLYEGADLGSSGPVGLITYMRTDSTRISDVARDAAAQHIAQTYGEGYVRKGQPKAKKGPATHNIQDAHEAIRPTDVRRTPAQIADHVDPSLLRLYELIWRRFVASQMAAARFLNTRATIVAGDHAFRATGSVLKFDGFQKVWKRGDDDKEKEERLPALNVGDSLPCGQAVAEQRFTQPPPRYTEASLIKELEERGIGRPSTYAPTIEVIQERNYVRQEERRLHPSALGTTVDSLLREHFPDIVDVDFTAGLEKKLDAVEVGERAYEPTVREWYDPFNATVEKAETDMQRVKVPVTPTGEMCPECEIGELVVREGRFGEFTGCSRYPDCSYIKDKKVSATTGEDCPQCGKPLVERQSRRGPFVGCSGYPTCRYIKPQEGAQPADGPPPANEELGACPDCGKPMARKSSRRGSFVGCTGYPGCKYIRPGTTQAVAGPPAQPTGDACPDCGKPLVTRQGRFGPFVSCSGYPGCKYRPPKGVKVGATTT
ncbi:MAG: type I DNA topoisomerase [Candidatus Dormibacteria bacterium]